jgi:hypothetical protein
VWEVFLYVGRLRIHGKIPQGRLPTYGKTSHIWEDFPYMWGCSPIIRGVYPSWASAVPCVPPVGRPRACFSLLGFAWPGFHFMALTPPKSLNGRFGFHALANAAGTSDTTNHGLAAALEEHCLDNRHALHATGSTNHA